jgi:hypothetical protein
MQILDELLKITQILFYLVAGGVAVLTYRSAKNGLLNTVNTEYQKKVISRLDEIAKELSSEFNEDSPNYWVKINPIKEMVVEINDVFIRNREYILEIGDYPFGIVQTANMKRLNRFLSEIESDPFVPASIRNLLTSFLEMRISSMQSIYWKELESYSKSLVKGKPLLGTDGDDPNFDKFHNKIVEKLNKKGCGISEVEAEVNNIRMAIQHYFDRFNPIKEVTY